RGKRRGARGGRGDGAAFAARRRAIAYVRRVRARRAQRRVTRRALALASGLALAACAGLSRPGAPATDAGSPPRAEAGRSAAEPGAELLPGFPRPEALAELGETAVPADLFDRDRKDVDAWQLAGPFPERLEARPSRR